MSSMTAVEGMLTNEGVDNWSTRCGSTAVMTREFR
jgi:hypothetical protein